MTFPTPNHDESLIASEIPFIGNFHKTLPHNEYGEVDASAYREFKNTCLQIEAGAPKNFESVPRGSLSPIFHPDSDKTAILTGAKFTNPLSGAATETHGPDPKNLEMLPAPGILSDSMAAEMIELYWMALLRDLPLASLAKDSMAQIAVAEIKDAFDTALTNDKTTGRLRIGLDLPQANGALDIRQETIFRCGLHDEEYGPLVSQFFMRNIPYGVQTIDPRQVPYIREKDFLTNHDDWLRAQNTGKDKFGRDYGTCNYYGDQLAGRETYYPNPRVARYISTMRDLARFVNRDALHQAYFNAALFLDSIGAPLNNGNPYKGNLFSREGGFATLGGPDLLTLVSEVASRALKVVWRQKWFVHRRARPEVYGGLMQMQFNRFGSDQRNYGLPAWVAETEAATRIKMHNCVQNNNGDETLFLPIAFSAGSPSHPAYGAGHATVAGACVTVLKAWFDEDAKLNDLLKAAQEDKKRKDPLELQHLLQPGTHINGEAFNEPEPYTGPDTNKMTVGGELNKIASNVAMGRSMGGVHWRSDNTRSMRLGEQIAIEILRKRTLEYAEKPTSFTFRSFDRQMIHITQGQVMKLS
ncbi:phosphoesterase [Nitrosomonas sp. PY1]|uniref:vanadium-dependent haloperoxidase n=1 Tax=Nitrosomonas sp. PY1 TaxID=1803906 RepID=UPI001FC89A24|nr:vanadium-dependent haloperoxidase [Nitrosomonas sp. PY1]GKS68345.1 phosphoesterase [Nitrosomonas sp. PY1]